MANLYRKPVVRKDPTTGEKIKAKSTKWWGQYKDANGRLRRHPLSVDKRAAQAMLNEIVRKVELEKAGLVDRTDDERKRPLKAHLDEYKSYLQNKGVTELQQKICTAQIRKIMEGCKWKLIQDITVASALAFLGDLRTKGRSAQTYNHYLKSLKSFTRWLVRDRRIHVDPVAYVTRLNVATDRRHDRRALSPDEFARLLEAARTGKSIEEISGPDRAMMYALAAWTGFRKGEIGSLTLRSLNLDSNPPTATVLAMTV